MFSVVYLNRFVNCWFLGRSIWDIQCLWSSVTDSFSSRLSQCFEPLK